MLKEHKRNISIISSLLFIILLVFIYYSYFYFQLDIPVNLRDLYLVLAYPSDPLYLKIIASFNDLENIPQGKNIVNYFLEIAITYIIGLKYVWLTVPVFKSISISIIFLSIKELYNLKFNQQLTLILFLFFLFFTDNMSFSDRFSRPHLAQVLLPISYLFFIKFGITKNKISLIISVVTVSFVVLSDPWTACFFLIFYSIYLFIRKQFKDNLLTVIIFLSCSVLMFFSTTNSELDFNSSLQLEYLGYKVIYSQKTFIIDYFTSIFVNYHILISLLILSVLSYFNKSYLLFCCVSFSIILGWLPYLIINSSIQAYHTILSAQTFLTYIIIFEVGLLISKYIINFSSRDYKYLLLILLLLIFKFNNHKSRIFSRADNLYKNYNSTFNTIEGVGQECEIFSNDIYARAYTLAFTKNKLSVSDGFYNPLPIKDIINDIAITMNFLKINYNFKNKHEYLIARNKFLHYASHNYFSTSKSLVAPSLKESVINFKNINKFKSTFQGWNMVYPDFDYNFDKIINKTSGLIILKNDYNYFSGEPIIINLCE